MLKKTIAYTDYNGNEKTKECYFNLNEVELAEMDVEIEGGMQKMLEKIVEDKDNKSMFKIFKQIILKSYGEKSEDGETFKKSPAISEAFSQTAAFVALFMELATNDQAAANFMNGIIPQKARNTSKALPNA